MAHTVDARLLAVLVCPDSHHAALAEGTPDDPDADVLSCPECGRVYRVERGIPVLLLEDSDDD